MARKPREKACSGIFHLILRGNDQQNLFYDESDKLFFINRIKKYSIESKIDLFAFCLMSNHVHFLIGKGNDNMALFVKKLTCSYVYRFNRKYQRTGHLFQGRYKSEPVETEDYFKTVYRYILRNPEKANICEYRNYNWSSLLLEKNHDFINYDFIISIFSNETHKNNFLNMENNDFCMESFSCIGNKNDDELKTEFINLLFDIPNPLFISKLPDNLKKEKIKILKRMGISKNQIARLTSINRYVIQNA